MHIVLGSPAQNSLRGVEPFARKRSCDSALHIAVDSLGSYVMQSFRFNIVIYVFSQNIIIKRRRPSDDNDPFVLNGSIAGGCVE